MTVAAPSPADIADRMAIADVLHRYCRAMDRMDRALALSCWHPGATDEHTPLYAGTAEGFVDWVWRLHEPMVLTRHVLSNVQIEIDGDEAWSESCWDVLLRIRDGAGLADVTGGGRYLDHLACRDGRWAIVHRRSVQDWDRIDPVTATMAYTAPIVPNNPDATIYPATRDRNDPSYAFLGGHARRFG